MTLTVETLRAYPRITKLLHVDGHLIATDGASAIGVRCANPPPDARLYPNAAYIVAPREVALEVTRRRLLAWCGRRCELCADGGEIVCPCKRCDGMGWYTCTCSDCGDDHWVACDNHDDRVACEHCEPMIMRVGTVAEATIDRKLLRRVLSLMVDGPVGLSSHRDGATAVLLLRDAAGTMGAVCCVATSLGGGAIFPARK